MALAVAALIGAASFTTYGVALDRLSIDLLHLIHLKVFGPSKVSDEIAILAIDEETYRDDHFRNLPQALWTPELGDILQAVLDAGPKAVGIDIIIGTTADSISPGYDRPWLKALRRAADENRIVLGFAQNQGQPILPTQQQRVAVRDIGNDFVNHGAVNPLTDADGVVRQMPLAFASGKGPVPTLSAGLYEKAIGAPAAAMADRPPLLLNFAAAKRPLLYSLADLAACVEAQNSDFFRQQFAGKVVILGGILDIEDRKLTSNRFATLPEGQRDEPRCVREAIGQKFFSGFSRDTIPGVLIHAAAVDNLLHGSALTLLPAWLRALAITAIAFVAALIFLFQKPKRALPIWVALALAWSVLGALAFTYFLVLPLITGLIAMSLAGPAGLALRMGSMDRSRRQLRQAFSLYLPKSEVDRLVREEKLPALGGELRDVTILFSDIASYSTLSERVAPGPLVDELNRYFGRMTDIVQAHGGFVDKFIGDGVLAIFGAPLARENAAADAVRASLAMIQSLKDEPLFIGGDGRIAIRIGLHRGEAIVGNIGSAQRFNYTVMGDAVNVASRLEGVGKHYHIPIVVSEQVQEAAARDFAFRELDFIRVVGRDQPVRLYQPLSADSAATLDLPGFAVALELWRKGQFVEAGKAFAALAAKGDELAARYVSWAQTYAETPMSHWEGIIQQGSK
ncbi:adenylate/guanylate cyclase domain-containing protein [Dongia rigui]|uniref:Adenylate/guanylate cyclase domain-containing protein n=1 Tax=Dongia rigui TaxID=940149 RepID=A0ABU5E102_9PROT|nr:adenylate/guanylate cyclase domain-containing protein [Dongia rigui]MDY0873221.1 adenylate/guanylate cyclase domain-containing protein [Dongia rigui]